MYGFRELILKRDAKTHPKLPLQISSVVLVVYMKFFIVSLFRRRSRVRVIKVTPACRKWSSGDNIALVSRVSNEDTEVSRYQV